MARVILYSKYEWQIVLSSGYSIEIDRVLLKIEILPNFTRDFYRVIFFVTHLSR